MAALRIIGDLAKTCYDFMANCQIFEFKFRNFGEKNVAEHTTLIARNVILEAGASYSLPSLFGVVRGFDVAVAVAILQTGGGRDWSISGGLISFGYMAGSIYGNGTYNFNAYPNWSNVTIQISADFTGPLRINGLLPEIYPLADGTFWQSPLGFSGTFSTILGLFTTDPDIVNFNSLNADQVASVKTGAQLHSALAGDDFVFLPDTVVIPSTGKSWDAGKFFLAGEGNDFIHGGNLNDHIAGGAGNDSVSGGNGADILMGGAGDDTFTPGILKRLDGDKIDGGEGADTVMERLKNLQLFA